MHVSDGHGSDREPGRSVSVPNGLLATAGSVAPTGANRLGIDYRVEAGRLPWSGPIVDIHAHTGGVRAAAIYKDVMDLFGVRTVFTQVRVQDAASVRSVLGDRVKFIAFPNFRESDRRHAFTEGYLEDIATFHATYGARMIKLWNAPRLRELITSDDAREIVEFDGAWRIRHAELAERLGMMFMVHVADPDTWFRTRYSDASRFGAKIDHYRGLRVMLDRFKGPWLAAHMGGWPEDLAFLDSLLTAHPNLYLDTSATKWVVRELSAHPRDRVVAFFEKWQGRVLFGSDIVTTDEHLTPKPEAAGVARHPMADLADSPASAFTLYASRYMALRLMLETRYEGPGLIADPDLMMVDPSRYDDGSAPSYQGIGLSREVLESLYGGAAAGMFAKAGIQV